MVATTDPATLPDRSTWYLATNLPAPGSQRAQEPGTPPAADLAEVVRLYGLRMWVEQADKQTKHALGWAQYQVRADAAIRRHWQLACCAFSFCWRQPSPAPAEAAPADSGEGAPPAAPGAAGRGGNTPAASAAVLAGGATRRARLAGAVGATPALLAGVGAAAPAARPRRPA